MTHHSSPSAHRRLIGLSVGSGLEGIDAALVRVDGIGLDLVPRVERAARLPFAPVVRDRLRPASPESQAATHTSPELARHIADTAAQAIRQVSTQAGLSSRDIFAVGLLEPARPRSGMAADCIPWQEVTDRLAEQTGLTVLNEFRSRDRAAGGSGYPITAAGDYLLFRDQNEERLIIHVGAVSNVLFVPKGGAISTVFGFEPGPGNQFLDALIYHGTLRREAVDPGGKRAVQGCCLEPLLANWLAHPFLTRKPPKSLHSEAFGKAFLVAAFNHARQLGAGVPDLLCTASHLVARAAGDACRQWLPTAVGPRRVFLSGGGVRNGFLWQLIGQQFDAFPVARTDELKVPALARAAAATAVLTALLCDGVPGNLPYLTGANGGRLMGHISPGDGRNWARCTAWIAEQCAEQPRFRSAA